MALKSNASINTGRPWDGLLYQAAFIILKIAAFKSFNLVVYLNENKVSLGILAMRQPIASSWSQFGTTMSWVQLLQPPNLISGGPAYLNFVHWQRTLNREQIEKTHCYAGLTGLICIAIEQNIKGRVNVQTLINAQIRTHASNTMRATSSETHTGQLSLNFLDQLAAVDF